MNSMGEWAEKAKRLWPSQLIKDGVINMRLIMIGLLGVGLLVAGGVFDRQIPKAPVENTKDIKLAPANVSRSYEEVLEAKLANILSQVKGAGAVVINITLESTGAQEHAKNVVKENKVVQEKDTSGGVRTTTESKESEQILMSRENSADHPVMVRETKPTIKGVLVIADGAQDSIVKANLTKAVEAGLGVAPYKITVLPQRK
jgi:stage III sporulation protein AG